MTAARACGTDIQFEMTCGGSLDSQHKPQQIKLPLSVCHGCQPELMLEFVGRVALDRKVVYMMMCRAVSD